MQANFNLGNVYRQTGIYEAAEFCYRAVLTSVPNHWRALLNLAVALAGMERTAEAQKCLRKAFKASGVALLPAGQCEERIVLCRPLNDVLGTAQETTVCRKG